VLPGRRTVKTDPLPGSLVTVTSPPIIRAAGYSTPSMVAALLAGCPPQMLFNPALDDDAALDAARVSCDEGRRSSIACPVCSLLGSRSWQAVS
jgi:hypothetical protein